MNGVTYHHGGAVGATTLEELRKALTFFYGEVTVDGEGPGVVVTVPAGLTEKELGDVVRHFLRGHHEVVTKVIAKYPAPAGVFCALPPDDRIALGSGIYLQGSDWSAAMARTRSLIRERLAVQFAAPLLTGSALIPRDVLVRAGYYRKFPNLVNAVSRIRPDYWDGVAVARLRPSQLDALSTFYVPSGMVLNPVTCYHVYANARQLWERYATGLCAIEGPVFRHESHNHSPIRLGEFTMFELVRLGSEVEVSKEFARMLDAFADFFTSLGVPHRIITASDAFFGDEPSLTRDAQLLSGSKFEVRIPLLDGELSVASVNLHGTVFADAFDLHGVHGIETSCCAGIGLDRLTYALGSYRIDL